MTNRVTKIPTTTPMVMFVPEATSLRLRRRNGRVEDLNACSSDFEKSRATLGMVEESGRSGTGGIYIQRDKSSEGLMEVRLD